MRLGFTVLIAGLGLGACQLDPVDEGDVLGTATSGVSVGVDGNWDDDDRSEPDPTKGSATRGPSGTSTSSAPDYPDTTGYSTSTPPSWDDGWGEVSSSGYYDDGPWWGSSSSGFDVDTDTGSIDPACGEVEGSGVVEEEGVRTCSASFSCSPGDTIELNCERNLCECQVNGVSQVESRCVFDFECDELFQAESSRAHIQRCCGLELSPDFVI